MEKITEIKLDRLSEDQSKTAERLDRVRDDVADLSKKIAVIETKIDKESPWWVKNLVVPLILSTVIATVGAVIHLEIVVSGLGKDTTRQALISQAALSPEAFTAALPDFANTVQKARRQQVPTPQGILDDLQAKLMRTDAQAPSFWPAAAAFITYKSSLAERVLGFAKSLPDCTDHPPVAKLLTPVPGPGTYTVEHTPAEYHDCTIVLDSDKARAALNREVSWTDVVFRHCVIIYNGGDLVFAAGQKRVGRATFDNCAFLITLQGAPPTRGQEFTRTLLSATGARVMFEAT